VTGGFVFEKVVCGYDDTMVVRRVGASVAPGRVLGVLGRNGVGKTTLMRALAGFLPLAGGRVTWQGQDLAGIEPHRRLGLGIAYAPQENVVFGELSVADNLWLHLPDRGRERYADAFEQFPLLAQRLRQRAGSLSGGERKLLSFTRTLGLAAALSLLDEPTEGVQPENIDRMARLLNVRVAAGASFIVVEQNLAFVETVADDVLVLDHGEVVAEGAITALGRDAIEAHLVV
jgi:ABC-type branched-subunit amino acid transport system ATPase component